MRLLDRMEAIFLRHFGEEPDLWAGYPGPGWGPLPWCWRLMQGLRLAAMMHQYQERAAGRWGGVLCRRMLAPATDAFLFHYDASPKLRLFQKLADRPAKGPVLVPEVGPCGFDILSCYLASHRSIVGYDLRPDFVECCREIWSPLVELDLQVCSTAEFDFERWSGQVELVVLLDWSHDNLAKRIPTTMTKVAYHEHPRDYHVPTRRRPADTRIDSETLDAYFSKLNRGRVPLPG